MDIFSLLLLSFGLSLDDFALAFALCLIISATNRKDRIIQANKMALAFSISTGLLPLVGWLIGILIFQWVESFSAWVILLVFCGVGLWIIKEAFEDEHSNIKEENLKSFWFLLVMGILGSIDEGVVGIGYPFLEIPVFWIIISVIILNTLLVNFAMLISGWTRRFNKKLPSILSGLILIILGIINGLKIVLLV